MDNLRVGVVGLGMMGVFHTKAYQSLPYVTVVGAVDQTKEQADKFASELGVKIYDSLDELLPHIDALSVCTPDDFHKDIVIQAFRAGVKVLVEKPLEISVAACEEILAARPDPTYLMVGQTLRFDPRVCQAKAALDSGDLGDIYYLNIHRSNPSVQGKHYSKRSSVAWFLGIHDIDAVLWITGRKIVEVKAMGRKLFSDNWDYVSAQLRLDNGVIVCMENSWTMPPERYNVMDAGLRIVGSKGMIEVSFIADQVRLSTQALGRSAFVDVVGRTEVQGKPGGALRTTVEFFVESVLNNRVPPVTGEEAMEAVRAIEWIERELDKQ